MADTITGRAPTTPLDFYGIQHTRGVGVITHAPRESISSTVTSVQVKTNATVVAGAFLQGMNVEVTLGNSSVTGYTACTLYAELDYGTGRSISGRVSVIEAKLTIPASDSQIPTLAVLCLDFENNSTFAISNTMNAYIMLRQRASTGNMMSFVNFHDIASIPAADASKIVATSSTCTGNTKVRCSYGVAGTPLWLIASTSAPD